jgi:hypothetical protein
MAVNYIQENMPAGEQGKLLSTQISLLNIDIMERLDQGHLHPKLEVPGLTWESNPGLGGGIY